MENIDIKRTKLATWVKWIFGLAGAAIISPIIFLVVKGLVGLAIAFVVGIFIIQFAPVVSLKIANLKMKALVSEVEANPIETMKNLLIEKTDELDKADQNIVEFETEIANFDDEVKSFSKQYPDEAPTYKTISEKMHDGLNLMQENQEDARGKLQDLDSRIQKAEAIYKMSLAAARVASFNKAAQAKVFQDIKEKVAFDTVRTELNRSFASLNMSLSKRTERPMITAGSVSYVTAKVSNKEAV